MPKRFRVVVADFITELKPELSILGVLGAARLSFLCPACRIWQWGKAESLLPGERADRTRSGAIWGSPSCEFFQPMLWAVTAYRGRESDDRPGRSLRVLSPIGEMSSIAAGEMPTTDLVLLVHS